MAKTVTIRLDENIFKLFKTAANGERRSISNFLEYASLSYLTNEMYVTDEEMNDILRDKRLIRGLTKGLREIKNSILAGNRSKRDIHKKKQKSI